MLSTCIHLKVQARQVATNVFICVCVCVLLHCCPVLLNTKGQTSTRHLELRRAGLVGSSRQRIHFQLYHIHHHGQGQKCRVLLPRFSSTSSSFSHGVESHQCVCCVCVFLCACLKLIDMRHAMFVPPCCMVATAQNRSLVWQATKFTHSKTMMKACVRSNCIVIKDIGHRWIMPILMLVLFSFVSFIICYAWFVGVL